MAEIRKHDPATGNAIAQALRAAMGEQVRPNVPGERRASPAAVTPVTDSVVELSFTTVTEPADEQDSED
jgi:hypothetical protein